MKPAVVARAGVLLENAQAVGFVVLGMDVIGLTAGLALILVLLFPLFSQAQFVVESGLVFLFRLAPLVGFLAPERNPVALVPGVHVGVRVAVLVSPVAVEHAHCVAALRIVGVHGVGDVELRHGEDLVIHSVVWVFLAAESHLGLALRSLREPEVLEARASETQFVAPPEKLLPAEEMHKHTDRR